MILSALVLAAATGASPFFDDFGGAWTCGNASYHEQWDIHRDGNNPWIAVVYGDEANPDGHAVVGWLPQAKTWVYDDFHADGAYAQLTAEAPQDHVWVWTGTYFPRDGTPDPNPHITWKLMPDGTIARTFAKRTGSTITTMGSDTCRRAATP
jgi:hypothetical protein